MVQHTHLSELQKKGKSSLLSCYRPHLFSSYVLWKFSASCLEYCLVILDESLSVVHASSCPFLWFPGIIVHGAHWSILLDGFNVLSHLVTIAWIPSLRDRWLKSESTTAFPYFPVSESPLLWASLKLLSSTDVSCDGSGRALFQYPPCSMGHAATAAAVPSKPHSSTGSWRWVPRL